MLRYGVILGDRLNAWQLACVQELERSGLAQLACVVSDRESNPVSATPRDTPYARFCARLSLPSHAVVAPTELLSLRSDVVRLHASSTDLSLVGRTDLTGLGLDFFLLFSNERLGYQLADASKYGVWYFAHSDLALFSSDAPGFWEIYHDHDVTAALLLRLTSENSAGVVLKSAYLPTLHGSLKQNLETVFSLLPHWAVAVCRDITGGAAGYFGDQSIPRAPVHFNEPTVAQIRVLQVLEARNKSRDYLKVTFYSPEWNVAVVAEAPSDFIRRDARASVTYLYPSSRNRYLADPCVLERDSQIFVFCEEYQNKTGRGIVAAFQISEAGATPPKPMIQEPYHLSYPQIFEHDGDVFCIPESSKIGKVRLYRAIEFPNRWQCVQTLLDGFAASDSTIVKFNGKWWLFCTSSEMLLRGHNSVLYIWHADDLFGAWTPHVRNPVKIDARSSRPAGALFIHDGRLYRPAQDCSRSYGELIRINRIDVLTENDFRETPVGIIRAPLGKYDQCIHTISSTGDWCVVDACRHVFRSAGFLIALKDAVKNTALAFGVTPKTLTDMTKRLKRTGRRASVSADNP